MKEIANKIIKDLNLREGSGSWHDYEKAKRFIYENYPNLDYYSYQDVIKFIVDYLGV